MLGIQIHVFTDWVSRGPEMSQDLLLPRYQVLLFEILLEVETVLKGDKITKPSQAFHGLQSYLCQSEVLKHMLKNSCILCSKVVRMYAYSTKSHKYE